MASIFSSLNCFARPLGSDLAYASRCRCGQFVHGAAGLRGADDDEVPGLRVADAAARCGPPPGRAAARRAGSGRCGSRCGCPGAHASPEHGLALGVVVAGSGGAGGPSYVLHVSAACSLRLALPGRRPSCPGPPPAVPPVRRRGRAGSAGSSAGAAGTGSGVGSASWRAGTSASGRSSGSGSRRLEGGHRGGRGLRRPGGGRARAGASGPGTGWRARCRPPGRTRPPARRTAARPASGWSAGSANGVGSSAGSAYCSASERRRQRVPGGGSPEPAPVARGGLCEDGLGFGLPASPAATGSGTGAGASVGAASCGGSASVTASGAWASTVRQLGRGVQQVGNRGLRHGGRSRELPYGDTRGLDGGAGVHRLRLALGGGLRGDVRCGLLVGLGGELGLRRGRDVRDELRVRHDRLFRYDDRRVQYGFRLRGYGFGLRYDDQVVLGRLRHGALGLLRGVRRLGGRPRQDGAGLGVPGGRVHHNGIRDLRGPRRRTRSPAGEPPRERWARACRRCPSAPRTRSPESLPRAPVRVPPAPGPRPARGPVPVSGPRPELEQPFPQGAPPRSPAAGPARPAPLC